MIDQRVSEGLKIDLFNKPALTTTIPAQFVKKYGAKIVPVYVERLKNHKFKIKIYKSLEFSKDDSVNFITLSLNKIMEKMRNNLVNTVEDLSPYEYLPPTELKRLLRSRGLLDSGKTRELIERLSQSDKNHIKIPLSKTSIWSNGRSKEHLDLMNSLDEISERLYYDDICIRLEEYTDGVKCGLDSIPFEEELILTVSW